MFPLLHTGRPWFAYCLFPYPNTMELWPHFKSPLLWDVFAVSTYFTVSLLFWYLGLIPDLATLRDARQEHASADRLRHLRARLARLGDATGTTTRSAYLMLAGLSTPLVLSVHTIVSLRLRHLAHPRLAHHDLPALLRRRRRLLRLRDGDDAG